MAREGDFYFQNKRNFGRVCIPPQGKGPLATPYEAGLRAPSPVRACFVLASYKRGFKGGNAPFEMRYIE